MIKELLFMNIVIIFILFMTLFILLTNIMNSNPIMIMINLLMYSMMICIKISLWKSNFLYSIILFLIMISGLLIIFIYFSSLISNEKINFKFNKLLYMNLIFNFIILIMLNYNLNFMSSKQKKFNFYEINPIMKINEMNYQNILSLYEYPFNNLTIISMFYLLITLISIIKICSIKSMTLRKISS
uniref:NADH-ubiquinone oxidoreductase chain 6 n=1 Tax=Acropyga sauteri TaxID=602226 RepID=A0A6G5NIA4_9HYME|nr:NADH dehydrogenase subunit 6 [Acropyga sauteri]QBG38683.1 NADH dehydrogenase subunit 6 [Acropyga sauteri]